MWIIAEDGNFYNTAHLVSIYLEQEDNNRWSIFAKTVLASEAPILLAHFDDIDESKARSILDGIQKKLVNVIDIAPMVQRHRSDRING